MPHKQMPICRTRVLLAALLAGLPLAAGAQEQASRLRYTVPAGWQEAQDPATQLVSLAPPGGGASVTFAASAEFAGTGEQWHAAFWKQLVQSTPLVSQEVPGEQGAFQTSMGVFQAPDGSHPWICLYTLVDKGHGEAVLFIAADQPPFFAYLVTVNEMIYRVTVGGAPATTTTRAAGPPASAPVARANPPAAQPFPQPAAPAAPPLSVRVGSALPTIDFTMAQDFFGGSGPGTYMALNGDGSIGVYAFRPFSGDFQQTFDTTLFRDWINGQMQERRILQRTAVQPVAIPGATQALIVQFSEEYFGGTPRQHIRAAILASDAVALIDISVQDADSMQRYSAQLNSFFGSVRVAGASPSPAPGPAPGPAPARNGPAAGGPAQGSVAGLYIATKYQFQPNPLGGVGSGSWVAGTESYLFSADGRVYRARGLPDAPGGNVSRFDFAAAQRSDPANTGTYTVSGSQVIITLGGGGETVSANRTAPDALEIYNVAFKRQ